MARPKGSKNVTKELDLSAEREAQKLSQNGESGEQIEQELQKMGQVLENVQQISKDFQNKLEEDKITLVDVILQEESLLTPEQIEAEVVKAIESFEEGNSEPFVDPATIVEWPYVLDGQGKLVPASLVSVKSVDFNVIVKQWLYLASLGAELNDKVTQQLDFLPYQLFALIPTDKYEQYNANLDAHNTKQDGVEYLEVMVNYPDRYSFLAALREFGVAGGFVSPTSRAIARPFSVNILTRIPFIESPHLRLKGAKIKYSEEELKQLNLEQLRIAAGWYNKGAKGRDKAYFIKEILKLQ